MITGSYLMLTVARYIYLHGISVVWLGSSILLDCMMLTTYLLDIFYSFTHVSSLFDPKTAIT
jgi:hypothetical protein